MKFTRNRLVVGLLVAVGVAASVVLGSQSFAVNGGVYDGSDCSTNSIIKCGVTSPNNLRSKVNSSKELQALYGHFGWSTSDINRPMQAGIAYRDGTIRVNGKTVATNAHSVGRHKDNGGPGHTGVPFKVGSHTYYMGTTAQRFGYNGETVYVMFNTNGQFVGAIDKGCGNPIPATPVKPPKPVYTCNSLKATGQEDFAHNTLKFNYVTAATAKNGAKITGYSYNFGDGTTAKAGAKTSHTYTKSGTYTTTVTVHFTVKENSYATARSTSASCKTTVKPHKNVVAPPQVSCTGLSLDKISRTTYDLKATASAIPGIPFSRKAGGISGYTYTIKDANGKTVKTITKDAGLQTQQSESGQFTLTPGAYTAQVVVHSNAGDKTGPQCTVKFSVPAPHQIQVCRLSDQTLVTINENEFDSSKYSKDFADCEKVTVCDTTTNTVVTVTKNQAKESKYTTDMSKCQPTQPTPPELPHTGASDVVMSLVGAGSLIAALSYYVASRRAL